MSCSAEEKVVLNVTRMTVRGTADFTSTFVYKSFSGGGREKAKPVSIAVEHEKSSTCGKTKMTITCLINYIACFYHDFCIKASERPSRAMLQHVRNGLASASLSASGLCGLNQSILKVFGGLR